MTILNIIFQILAGVGAVFFFTIVGIYIGRNFYNWNGFFMTVIHKIYLKLMEGLEDKNKSQFDQLNEIRKFHVEQADLMIEKMKKINYSERE